MVIINFLKSMFGIVWVIIILYLLTITMSFLGDCHAYLTQLQRQVTDHRTGLNKIVYFFKVLLFNSLWLRDVIICWQKTEIDVASFNKPNKTKIVRSSLILVNQKHAFRYLPLA